MTSSGLLRSTAPSGTQPAVPFAKAHGLLPIPVACAVAFYAAFHVTRRPNVIAAGYGWVVFASTVLIFVLSFLGLAYSLYPYIVIDRLTVWQAASATKSLLFIFVPLATMSANPLNSIPRVPLIRPAPRSAMPPSPALATVTVPVVAIVLFK